MNTINQTIAFFRYLLIGLVNIKVLLFLLAISLTGLVVGQFVKELAIINGGLIALALTAEIMRYGLVFFMIVTVAYQISRDYELGQFDLLLSMPVSRTQYVLAQFLVILVSGLFFSVPILLSIFLVAPLDVAFYWFLSVYFELVLIGLFSMLAILSLEKLPVAIIFSLSIYLLSRLLPLIDSILKQSADYYSEEVAHHFSQQFFNLLQYVFPGQSAFAQNNILFDNDLVWAQLLQQSISVFVYGGFLLLVCLIDFYRKEFNR